MNRLLGLLALFSFYVSVVVLEVLQNSYYPLDG